MHVQSCRFTNQTYCIFAVLIAVPVVVYSRHSSLLAAIGKLRLEGWRYSWRNDPRGDEQGEMAVFAGYSFLRMCSSRKYPWNAGCHMNLV